MNIQITAVSRCLWRSRGATKQEGGRDEIMSEEEVSDGGRTRKERRPSNRLKDRGEPRQTDGRRQGHRRQLRMSAEHERGAKNEVKLKPQRRRQKQAEERTSREGQNLPNNPEDLAPRFSSPQLLRGRHLHSSIRSDSYQCLLVPSCKYRKANELIHRLKARCLTSTLQPFAITSSSHDVGYFLLSNVWPTFIPL